RTPDRLRVAEAVVLHQALHEPVEGKVIAAELLALPVLLPGDDIEGLCLARSFSTGANSRDPPPLCSSATRTGCQPSSMACWSSAITGSSPQPATSVAGRGLGDLAQELLVRLGRADLVDQQLERRTRVQGVEHAAQAPDQRQLLGRHEPLLLARPRGLDVDGGEDALLGQLPVEAQLLVPGALELLEDDLVHAGPGLDERARDDRERAALLDVARGAEKSLRRVQRGGVDTTRQDASGRRRRQVVG